MDISWLFSWHFYVLYLVVIGAIKWPWFCDKVCGELGLHRGIANSILSQFGEI